MRVTDTAAFFDVSLAAVSKHIGALESAGVVKRSVEGRDHVLSLEPVNLYHARRWIDGYREFWEGRLDVLEALLRERGDRLDA
jgi:DNA-binding transcriptional ArsR family regulator